ncbi:ImmA/IrrE family metallo-endopeptidase [Thermus scotoductus]|uniref:ImmA/IrrE family metallo-endopeptidase n=1 Tax=Thermus scotoductus TaxID=37636 RepID=UPI00056F0C6E|nr:ImmA/IrrE family metallo-endopeptidase [Thermus scotoductus]
MVALKSLREARGLTQEALAARLGVSRQAVHAWETGKATPSLLQGVRLARILGVPVEALLGEAGSSLPLLFRAEPGEALGEGHLQALAARARAYREVEALLGLPGWLPEARPFPHLDPRVKEDRERLEALAVEVRKDLGSGDGPLGDPIALLEDNGLKVFLLDLPEGVSGLSAYAEDLGGVVFLNKGMPVERQYFTALHELAHLVLHRGEYGRKAQGRDAKERAADYLAGAILLPRHVVLEELGPYAGLSYLPEGVLRHLKQRYGVSMRTVLVRAAQVGILPRAKAFAQKQVLDRRYGEREEPEPLERPPTPSRLERLVFAALAQGKLTLSRAAEILGLPLREADRRASAWLQEVPA